MDSDNIQKEENSKARNKKYCYSKKFKTRGIK